MRLIELTINNFGSYKDNTIFRFEDDITVYQGPNGAGKSTMIEAIFYAFFGELAKDGVKDFDYVPLNKQGIVTLTFEHKTEKYVIERSLKPSIRKNGSINPNRKRKLTNLTKRKELKTEGAIEPIINQIIGEETTVKNSIYSPQGQLHSLISQTGEDLKKELSKFFGIEQYKSLALIWERLSKKANNEKDELEKQISLLKESCDKIPDIKKQLTDLGKEDNTLIGQIEELGKKAKALEGIQAKKTALKTEIQGLTESIGENTPKYKKQRNKLTEIEGRLSEEQLNNPENAVETLKENLREMSERIDILEPFIKEADPLVDELNKENGILEDRSTQLDESINNLIQKSNEGGSPHVFEKLEETEFIENNTKLVNDKIRVLEENEAILETLESYDKQIKSLEDQNLEPKIHNFVEKLSSLTSPEFSSKDLSSTKEEEYSKWLDTLQNEVIRLVNEEKALNNNLVEFKTKKNTLKDELAKKEETLKKLNSGEIDTCTECGTKLTPELRKVNQERTETDIGQTKQQISNLKENRKLTNEILGKPEFKNKIDIIEDNNLKIKTEERISELSAEFKSFKENLSNKNNLEKEFENLSQKLHQEWKSKFDDLEIQQIKNELVEVKEFYTSFFDDLKQIRKQLDGKSTKEKEVKTIEKKINQLYEKFKIDKKLVFDTLEAELEDKKTKRSNIDKTIQELGSYQELKKETNDLQKKITENELEKKSKENKLTKPPFDTLETDKKSNEEGQETANERRRVIASEMSEIRNELKISEKACEEVLIKDKRIEKLKSFAAMADSVATVFRDIRPKLLNYKTKRIVERTNSIVRNMPSQADTLRLDVEEDGDEYNLVVFRNGEKGKLGTVSGGEMTGLGFALRVAIAQELSNVGVLILDEPTYGLDKSRRSKLAEILVAQQHIKQLLVVTHDEIFKGKTTNITQIRQNNGASRNMADELGLQEDDMK